MTTQTTFQKTIATHSISGDDMIINIRLSDPCNNGHNDFAITADIYKKGKPHPNSNYLSGGCQHDEILAVKPSLKPFIDLHLSDEQGLPMHAIENGYYWFCNNLKTFANYMRVDFNVAKKLRAKIFTKEQFEAWVETMKPTYLKQANAAKKILKSL